MTDLVLLKPCDFPITSPFGAVGDTKLRTKPHGGVDFGCPSGTMLRAVFDGQILSIHPKVKEPEKNWQLGNWLVLVNYKLGHYVIYAHLSEFLARQGATVRRGDPICYSGNTGNSSGPHLHLQLHRLTDNEKIEPRFA